MGTKSSNWASKSAAVFYKDILSEFRTKYAVNAVVLFAVTTLTAVSFSIGGAGANASPSVLSALLWIILYFSAMSGLSRVFVKEEESKTASTLRLSAPPNAVYTGKLAFNLALLGGLEIIIVPMYVVMMNVAVKQWALFLLMVLVGSIGLAAASTVIAAIVARANAKGALFAVLSFPILLPLLFAAMHGTRVSFETAELASGIGDLKILIAYAGVMITASLMLFKFVWEE